MRCFGEIQNLLSCPNRGYRTRFFVITHQRAQHFRDTYQFQWITTKESEQVEILRFARAIFSLGEAQFLLNSTTNVHLETYLELIKNIEETQESLYVDNIVTGVQLRNGMKIQRKLLQQQTSPTQKKELGTKFSDSDIKGIAQDKKKDTLGVNLKTTVTKTQNKEC